MLQPVQLLDVDVLERLVDSIQEDLHDEKAHERVEHDAAADDRRRLAKEVLEFAMKVLEEKPHERRISK